MPTSLLRESHEGLSRFLLTPDILWRRVMGRVRPTRISGLTVMPTVLSVYGLRSDWVRSALTVRMKSTKETGCGQS